MTLSLDREHLAGALRTVRSQLLSERSSAGTWVGELSSSPLATATAISALVLAQQGGTRCGLPAYTPGVEASHVDEIYQGDLSELIVGSLRWLAQQQNDDGGWGDTDQSRSNIATTMLVLAAFHLTGVPAKDANLLERAEHFVASQGGVAGLKKRYGNDKTFAVPILANCALADMVPWRKVSALPFELACLPQRWYRFLKMRVVSYAIPALVAIGQAKFHHCPPRNPLVRWIRSAACKRSLKLLEEMQPASGGFLEAVPLTGFVVMNLASMGQVDHPVVRRGVEFLLASVRADGSWPIDTNLAIWNTSQALLATDWQLDESEEHDSELSTSPSTEAHRLLDWLLACQQNETHRYTGAAPGGWSWTDRSGGVPDADDTAAALLALAAWKRRWPKERTGEVCRAARLGIAWLLDLQNTGGGWPTFCRGWGKLPFDRSSTDITAHALRALHVWRMSLRLETTDASLARRVGSATGQGLRFLESQQQADGSWLPLWFGNEHHSQEANPVYGTAKVLLMCEELGLGNSEMAQRAVAWLVDVQHVSGGWGPVDAIQAPSPAPQQHAEDSLCSIEETSLAIEALVPFGQRNRQAAECLEAGLIWLTQALETEQPPKPAAIGFYFAKLWYYERLYPQIFATRALQQACRTQATESAAIGIGT